MCVSMSGHLVGERKAEELQEDRDGRRKRLKFEEVLRRQHIYDLERLKTWGHPEYEAVWVPVSFFFEVVTPVMCRDVTHKASGGWG